VNEEHENEDYRSGIRSRAVLDSPISRRSLLRGSATLAGGALAFSVFGAAVDVSAADTQRIVPSAVTSNDKSVKYVTEDNYWLGGF
jgi:hypothetical protein